MNLNWNTYLILILNLISMHVNLIYVLSQAGFFFNLTLIFLAGFRAHINIIKEAKIPFIRTFVAYNTLLFYNLSSKHLFIVYLLFLNFCGSAIFEFKFQRLYLGSFSQNFLGNFNLHLIIFIGNAELIFRLLVFDLTLVVPIRWPGSSYEPFFVLLFHFQFDGWIFLKIIEILIDAFQWILLIPQ